MRFEWHDEKREENLAKHGVDFVDATRVFLDPGRIESYDTAHSEDEDRWWTIGGCNERTLFVIFTLRGGGKSIRLISARKATSSEAKAYHARRAR